MTIEEKIINAVNSYGENFKNKISVAKILNTNKSDVAEIAETMDYFCETLIITAQSLIIFIIFFLNDIWIALYVVGIMMLYLARISYNNILIEDNLDRQKKYEDKLTDSLEQNIKGLSEIKEYNMKKPVKSRFNNILNRWEKAFMDKRKYYTLNETILLLIPHIGKCVLYMILIYSVYRGKMGIDKLVLLVSYFESLTTNFCDDMKQIRDLGNNKVAIKRVNNILSYKKDENLDFGTINNDYINGLVEFDKVSFKINNNIVLDNISFIAKPNEITSIIGKVGSGKTSIVNILLRKYKITSGNVYVDNDNIYDYTNNAYTKNVVSVNNSNFIFDMSIKNNLSMVNKNVEEQINACKRVGLHDYIMSLPNKYNTILTNNADNFPNDKKQLLALARAILTNDEILIFDEFASILDNSMTLEVKNVINDLKVDHTILLITHKEELIKDSDNIIILNKGKKVIEGTYKKLKNKEEFKEIMIDKNSSKI